jgi:AcrR family transcriptional regulator
MEVKQQRGPGRPRNPESDARIVEACLTLLAEQGYDRCSMEAVAARAGVTRATVYRRHPSKPHMVTAAVSSLAGIEEDDGPESGLASVIGLVQQFRDSIEGCDGLSIAASLYVQREQHPEMLEEFRERVVHPCRRRLMAAFEAARENGQVRADADVELATDALIGGLLARHLAGVAMPADWAEQAVRGMWQGLAVGPGGAAGD